MPADLFIAVYDDLGSPDKIELPEVPAKPADAIKQKDRDIQINGLLDLCRLYLKGREREIEKRTRRDIEVVVSTFVDILTEHKVQLLADMQQFHLGALRQHFDAIIPGYGQSRQLASLSTKDLPDCLSKARGRGPFERRCTSRVRTY